MSVPASIYISTSSSEDIAELSRATINLIGALGYEVIEKRPPERGSWFQRFSLRLRDSADTDLRSRIAELERAAEVGTLSRQQAQIDNETAETTAQLIRTLADVQDAVIRIGTIVVIKADGMVTITTLTLTDVAALDQNPQLLKSPSQMLEFLEGRRRGGGVATMPEE